MALPPGDSGPPSAAGWTARLRRLAEAATEEDLLAGAAAVATAALAGSASGLLRTSAQGPVETTSRGPTGSLVAALVLADPTLRTTLESGAGALLRAPQLPAGAPAWLALTPLLGGEGEMVAILWVAGESLQQLSEAQDPDLRQTLLGMVVSGRLRHLHCESRMATLRADLANAEDHRHRFLANMSHELRTPLNAVIGFSELLLQDDSHSPEQRATFLKYIHGGGVHLLGLVNDVLDLSSLEAGHLELRLAPLDPVRVAREVLAVTENLARTRQVGVRLEAAEGGEMIADEAKLRQMLTNLVSSAISFSPAGETVIVAVRHEAGAWGFTVSDSGPEAGEADFAHDLAEFGQAPERSGVRRGGTGLGLALSRRLSEAHRGRLSVEPAGGRNTFRLVLPDLELEGGQERSNATAADPMILVIDDNSAAAALHRHMLSAGGYSVEVLRRGRGAVEWIRRHRPVAVVLDILLPDTDGWEVLRAIRAEPDLSGLPIVIASVLDDMPLGLSLGANEFHVKPIEQEGLLRTLDAPTAAPDGRRSTILAIDDDPASLAVTRSVVESLGFQMLEATDGATGIRLARSAEPGLILLDLSMPGMDGFEVLKRLRNRPATAGIPVVVLTGAELAPESLAGLSDATEAVIPKRPPFDDLRTLLRVATRRLRTRSPAAASDG